MKFLTKLRRMFRCWISKSTLEEWKDTWICELCYPDRIMIGPLSKRDFHFYLAKDQHEETLVTTLFIADNQGHDDTELISWVGSPAPNPTFYLSDKEIDTMPDEEFNKYMDWVDTVPKSLGMWPEDSMRLYKLCRKLGYKKKKHGRLIYFLAHKCAELCN